MQGSKEMFLNDMGTLQSYKCITEAGGNTSDSAFPQFITCSSCLQSMSRSSPGTSVHPPRRCAEPALTGTTDSAQLGQLS